MMHCWALYTVAAVFMTLKPVLESSDLDDDAPDQLFAGVPTHLNKGRGYLVCRLPSTAGNASVAGGSQAIAVAD